MLLGVELILWVYIAHYREAAPAGPTIFAAPRAMAWGLSPVLGEDSLAMQLSLAF